VIIDAFQDQFNDAACEQGSRLRAYRLPDPRVEPRFEDFEPFGLDPTH